MTSIQLSEILRALASTQQECVLATLVKVSGSSFRRPGARMLITSDGSYAGNISAGCLEDEIRERSFEWTRSGACLKRFNIGTPEDDIYGWGSGCKGTLEVLLERIAPDDAIIRGMQRAIEKRRRTLLATVTASSPGTPFSLGDRMLFVDDALQADFDPYDLRESLIQESQRQLKNNKIQPVEYSYANNSFTLLWEPVQPPIQLYVFGSGDGAKRLLDAARTFEWTTVLCDKHTELFHRQGGLTADAIFETVPGELPESFACDARTAAVIMTHNFADDAAILDALMRTQIPYIGVLGGRMRNDRLRQELAASFPPDKMTRLFAPIGLDIGAEDSVEIAASITAEVLAFMTGRDAGYLSVRSTSIHATAPVERRLLQTAAARESVACQSPA